MMYSKDSVYKKYKHKYGGLMVAAYFKQYSIASQTSLRIRKL